MMADISFVREEVIGSLNTPQNQERSLYLVSQAMMYGRVRCSVFLNRLVCGNRSGNMDRETKYLIVIEKGDNNYSAYSPDVPGCIATGETIEETLENMRDALTFHLEAIAEEGEPLPYPRGVQSYLDAVEDSAGEEYFLTHISIDNVLPGAIPA
jgi:predicted RNase H-like HicB family nuclease